MYSKRMCKIYESLAIITKKLICLQDIYQGVHSFHTLQLHHSILHLQIDIHIFNNTFLQVITKFKLIMSLIIS